MGSDLGSMAGPPNQSNSDETAPVGQRRQVTVLFADMAGYTAVAEALGEEQTYLLMQRVQREMSEAIHGQSGTVQEMIGDGIMALFGAPVAVEDAPLKACRAALDLQGRMSALAVEFEGKYGAAPRFRVGIHSGPLVVGEIGDGRQSSVTALGDTVNLASRIETAAEAGTILLSAATQALVEGFVDCEFVGEQSLKGKTEPQKLWRLDAVKEGVTRFDVSKSHGLTPLVGRDRELEQLQGLWRKASEGSLQTAVILGEAGIGKSRLAFELRESITDERAFFLECHCTAGTRETPFAPLKEIVRRSFRIADDAPAAETEKRLHQGLEMLGMPTADNLPYLMNLLGFTPQDAAFDKIAGETLGIRTRDIVIEMFRERCRATPTILIIEDLHWIDTAALGLLSRLVEKEQDLALFIIATARTGYQTPWSGSTGTSELELAPLSSSATEALLQARLGSLTPPEALNELVMQKSEGNPLFAEEIISYLHDNGSLSGEGDELNFSADQDAVALPVAVENLLMNRFDRLESGPRSVLETAAVTGTTFSAEHLRRATGLGNEIAQHLETLVRQDLIRADSGRNGYVFRHALSRDAIYDSLLSARREALHQAVAEAIEGQENFQSDDAADALSYHWSRSAEPGRAVQYLAIAGENSLRIYSLEEAQNHLQQALDIIKANPGCVDDTVLADILLHIARVLYFQFDFRALIALVEPYLGRIEALGDNRRLSRFLFETGYAHVFGCQAEIGQTLLDRSKALAEADGDELAVAYADLGFMWHRMFWGQPGEARDRAQREAGERIVEVGRRHGDIWLASKAQLANGLDYASWGRPGESRAALMELMAMSRESNDPRPRSMALWALAVLDVFSGNYDEAIEKADDALRICLSPVDRMAANGYKMMARMLSGQQEDAGALGNHLIRAMEEKSLTMTLPPVKMAVGIGNIMQGNMAKGVAEVEAAQAEAESWGMTFATVLGNKFLGEIYLQFVLSDETPPLSVMLANLPFLARTLPFAKKKARRYLQDALDGYQSLNSPADIAGAQYNLGLLDKAAKQDDLARAGFQKAREIALSVDAANIVSDADAALAELGAA